MGSFLRIDIIRVALKRENVKGAPSSRYREYSVRQRLGRRVLITLDKFETRDSRDAGGPLVLPRARCLVLVRSWPAGGMRRYAAAKTLTGLFAGITTFASRGKEKSWVKAKRVLASSYVGSSSFGSTFA